MDTSGFYSITSDNPQQMVMGPNFVYGPYNRFTLLRQFKDTYTYPVEGWSWFDTEEEACAYFGLPYPPEYPTIGMPLPLDQEII